MERSDVRRWVDGYERAWRSPGTDLLAELFTDDATYLVSPWAQPVQGLAAVRELWEAERDGPNDSFTMTCEVVAVEGEDAVVRVEVDYTGPEPTRWRDLWVLRFDGAGRCRSFEEWPFAEQPDGH